MTPPRPVALRLVARARTRGKSKPPRPPLGLATWSPSADAIAVLLDAGADDDPRTVAGVAAQLPHASTLPSGTAVFVLGKAAAARPFWRLLARDLPVPRAARCTALLVKGYVDIGADEVNADDLTWGLAP